LLTCTFQGAYAFFGPGKFENLHTSLNTPAADGRLHFAGEALSIRHAWVVGALDSAWRAVAEMLLRPEFAKYRKKFLENWGSNPEWIKSIKSERDKEGIPEGATVFDRDHSLLYEHLVLTQPA
jgi:Flavin containing amine oxidoreductase